MSDWPVRFDEEGRKRYEYARELMNGDRNQIPFAIQTGLDEYRGLPKVTNPALRNHLAYTIRFKLRRAALDAEQAKAEKKRAAEESTHSPMPALSIVLLD